MPAYNFHKQFAAAIESGEKCRTIRQSHKGARRGATAYLYTGQRTTSCRKLGEGTITDVLSIEIGRHACGEPYANIADGGKQTLIVHFELETFAIADGFQTAEEMVEWFAAQYGLPFHGFLHQWVPN